MTSDKKSHVYEGGRCVQVSNTMMEATRCQVIAWKRYWMQESTPPEIFLMKGKGVDKAAEKGFRAGLEGEEVSSKELTEYGVSEFEREVEGARSAGPIVIEEEDAVGPDPVAKAKDDLARTIPVFWNEVGRKIAPHPGFEPQQTIDTSIKTPEGTVRLASVLDLVAEEDGAPVVVVDVKTARKKWPPGKEHASLQPRLYVFSVNALSPNQWENTHTPQKTQDFRFANVYFNESRATAEVRPVFVEQKALESVPKLVRITANFYTQFAKGQAPLPTGFLSHHFLCNRRYCGYWRFCEQEYGIRIPE